MLAGSERALKGDRVSPLKCHRQLLEQVDAVKHQTPKVLAAHWVFPFLHALKGTLCAKLAPRLLAGLQVCIFLKKIFRIKTISIDAVVTRTFKAEMLQMLSKFSEIAPKFPRLYLELLAFYAKNSTEKRLQGSTSNNLSCYHQNCKVCIAH